MKKTLFLLLFIPTLSYSQITYKDIISIHSENTFKRAVIENGYELVIKDNKQLIYDNINHTSVCGLSLRDNLFLFRFFNDGIKNYNSIVDDIKNNCTFLGIGEFEGNDYVCYSCSESKYKGDIGFTIFEGVGIIQLFPKEE